MIAVFPSSGLSRRRFLTGLAGGPAVLLGATGSPGVRIREVHHRYEDFVYRTPLKFGGVLTNLATMLNVDCVVELPGGKAVPGFASMKMANVWAFRSRVLSYDDTLNTLKRLADRISRIVSAYTERGHPIDIDFALQDSYFKAAEEVTRELRLAEPIPKLCTLVAASGFDSALHDAFGKAHGRNCYQTYGPDLMPHDLSRYLGPDFRGEFLPRYLSRKPKKSIPMYHLVGGVDPITDADVKVRVGDGLPETLPEWIRHNGLTHFKIKLEGNDLKWDVERTVRVERAVVQTQQELGIRQRRYSLDFNEACPNVDYVLDFLDEVREKAPGAYAAIQYLEQPTQRNLKADRANAMHKAAKLKPVVIDESLTDLETLMLAREMGYSGVALKACKGQSKSLLMAAAAQKHRMFVSVQDSALPGAALVHSVGLAAYVPPVAAIEANARQFMPSGNAGWEKKFPGIFIIKDGTMRTADLVRPGLGAV
jgi:L-alanine-DL-glutamate epimerase-like enolase superfamily enzyme